MPCFAPIMAWRGELTSKGKRAVVFNLSRAASPESFRIPCGRCHGCRLEKSRQWAMRCLHEKSLHESSLFVTLTYDNKHLPAGGTLVKRDLQLFMKRLRKKFGAGIRFYACGEYGDKTMRPHYHLILFNFWLNDMKYIKTNRRGDRLFYSPSLEEIWTFGNNIIGEVSFESAAYVARYVMKKRTGEHAAWYEVTDADGVVTVREPEFCLMSRRPGIGSGWFDKFGNGVYDHDRVIMNGKEVRPPRYYDGRYEVIDGPRLAMLKCKRRRMAMRLGRKETMSPDRRKAKETIAIAQLALKGRVL